MVLFAGCTSHKPKPTAASTARQLACRQISPQTAGADSCECAYGSRAVANGSGAGRRGPDRPASSRTEDLFRFRQQRDQPDYTSLIAAHAKYLASNASIRVRLEGNTDERGSREYNIGLGERRAQAVRQALLLQGVAESQITTVSYGEERPAVTGHTEEAWSQNRRVEIVYLN